MDVYLKCEFQSPDAFHGIEEALDCFFIRLVLEPGGEGLTPCCDHGGDVGGEGGLVRVVGMESGP